MSLAAGAPFALYARTNAAPGEHTGVGVSYLGLINDVAAGDVLLLDDGLVSLQVDAIEGDTIRTTVINDGQLSDRKGLNRLGGGLSLDALTDKDRADIRLAAELDVDFLAVSFCRSAADMAEARRLAREAGSSAHLVAKFERAEAIERLTEIIDASDVVMVARGDLGVEIGDAELPGLQKKIIRESLARGRVVITATQKLQFEHDSDFEKAPRGLVHTDQAIALATMYLTEHIKVRAILALTESGGTAQHLSRFRSNAPIYGLSRHEGARHRMALMRGVYPIDFDSGENPPRQAARRAVAALFAHGALAEGDRVLITSGDHMGHLGTTTTLRLLGVGTNGEAEGLGTL